MSRSDTSTDNVTDVVLIGAGVMSATLGMLLKQLQPDITIIVIERLNRAAAESSDAWNNAGTGHSGFCELNYTHRRANGSMDVSKAIQIAESFEISKQFWAYLVQNKIIELPETFIEKVPHMTFVTGDANVEFLKARFGALTESPLFSEMRYTEDPELVREWMPLVMEGRVPEEKIAATRMDIGTDVNFGTLTRCMFDVLHKMSGVSVYFNQEVTDLHYLDHVWHLNVNNETNDLKTVLKGKFVFIGAGGGSLPLLLKSGIPEGKGFGGFPVSGKWLKCINPDVIKKHNVKVYGKASVGTPPMSVPHLDTRMIHGKKALLFGPFAGFTTKFLKNGSFLDLILSVKLTNILPMIRAGLANIDLTKYLIDQVRQSPEDRLNALREFVPTARIEDWELEIAGQRVQVIKKDLVEGGILEFGTEVVGTANRSLAALLGASPGASTAASIMINLLKQCFPDQMKSDEWNKKLQEMIPSFGQSLNKDYNLCEAVRARTGEILNIL